MEFILSLSSSFKVQLSLSVDILMSLEEIQSDPLFSAMCLFQRTSYFQVMSRKSLLIDRLSLNKV